MLRLLKYLPVLIPLVSRFVKSPQGKRTIAQIRRRIGKRGNGSAGSRR